MRYRSWKTTAVSSTLTWTRKSCISVLTEAWKSCGGPSGQMIFTSCLHTWPCSTGLRRPSSHPTTMTCQDLCCRPIGRAALCDLNIILVPLDFHFIIETTIGTAQMVLGAGGGYAHPSRFALGPGKTRRTSTWCLMFVWCERLLRHLLTHNGLNHPKPLISQILGDWSLSLRKASAPVTSNLINDLEHITRRIERREDLPWSKAHVHRLLRMAAFCPHGAVVAVCWHYLLREAQRRSASTWQKMWWSTSHLADELAKISQ